MIRSNWLDPQLNLFAIPIMRLRIQAFVVVLLFGLSGCLVEDTLAVVVTNPVTQITATSALSGGSIDRQGGPPPSAFGICWNTEPGPTIVDSRTREVINRNPAFLSSMDGLSPSTRYYVRAYSQNSVGIAYGNELSFTTLHDIPSVEITDIKFEVTGNFKASYSVVQLTQNVSNSGICWGQTVTPTISGNKQDGGPGTGPFLITLSVPQENVILYARAFATHSSGTAYSEAVSFGAARDADNNPYNIIMIGSRAWLRENLKTSHYSNGDPITEISNGPGTENAWKDVGASAFCQPPSSMPVEYANFYNGYAAIDPRNVCPTGWHVPTGNDLDLLIGSAGGASVGGHELREAGNAHWSNGSSTNSSRFTALPAGIRNEFGVFAGSSAYARFWSVAVFPGSSMLGALMLSNGTDLVSIVNFPRQSGHSVRCVKN